MTSSTELSNFLQSVERRAFKQAVYALHDESSALDVVQDSMMKLAEKYGDKPASELPMLFQRILQNVIHDWFRRQKVRSTWTTLFSSLSTSESGEEFDFLEALESAAPGSQGESASAPIERAQTLAIIEAELQKLPARQREAFILRYWEDMAVAETAAAMKCSEGSVKTHCSRATHALALALKSRGITL